MVYNAFNVIFGKAAEKRRRKAKGPEMVASCSAARGAAFLCLYFDKEVHMTDEDSRSRHIEDITETLKGFNSEELTEFVDRALKLFLSQYVLKIPASPSPLKTSTPQYL